MSKVETKIVKGHAMAVRESMRKKCEEGKTCVAIEEVMKKEFGADDKGGAEA